MGLSETEIDAHVQRVTRRFGRSIVQIFAVTLEGRPDPTGTGVLVAVAGRHFLFTAAHVLEDRPESNLYLAAPREHTRLLHGTVLTSEQPPTGDRSDDDQDIAVVELGTDLVRALPDDGFLTPSDLGVDDVAEEGAVYVVMGYPDRKTRRRESQTVQSQLYKYIASPKPDLYSAVQRDEVTSIVLKFRRKRGRFEGEQRVAPHPRGMSGGPVFRLKNVGTPFVSDVPLAKLTGIFTHYFERSHALIAPRISLPITYLKRALPELAPHLPDVTRFHPVLERQEDLD